ncbi:DUF1947 domain-containing protein [Fervidicoccus fontis]|uniref:PUA domain containing protein n=2 Tax=Fervidicoccus fontis TaxID=683846 RepID=I0A1J1_FERFK|nr:DUF1947 domain-containing protein [Fervidicoccus fontis]AFH42848.1 PUA domain containing protein [Fervidicoccus fontis Kam940]MBE9391633.1 DUF1947 domain-containing protein [Fervidicoccus fontis]
MRRHYLSKKEKDEILKEVNSKLKISLEPEKVEILESKEFSCYLFDSVPALCKTEDKFFPHLKYLLKHRDTILPKIFVDKGAVKPVSSGADLMAPGIVRIEGDFLPGDIVIVEDLEHKLPIAVMIAEMSSAEMKVTKKGRVARNIHYVGDKFWNV